MHGFNQGKQFLSELCSTADAVLIQEHWLQSHDCNKLNRFTDKFVGYSVSAMDAECSLVFYVVDHLAVLD